MQVDRLTKDIDEHMMQVLELSILQESKEFIQ